MAVHGPSAAGGGVAVTPEQRENMVWVLYRGLQTLHDVPTTATEEQFDEYVATLTTLWEPLLADARDSHRRRRKNYKSQN